MAISFFSPITKNPLIPLEENCSSLRFATQFFNFGQQAFEISRIDGKVCEVTEDNTKQAWLMIMVRVIAIATAIIPAVALFLLAIYRLSNHFKVMPSDGKDPKKVTPPEKKVEEIKPPEDCPTCFEPLKALTYVKLACNHFFHQICNNDWQKKGSGCPLCRGAIVVVQTIFI